MVDPGKLDKYLYIQRTPTWMVRALYVFGIVSWLFVLYGFSGALLVDNFFRWFVFPIVIFFTIYHTASFLLNTTYRQFDLARHHRLCTEFWRDRAEPSIDIFLPVCGEEIAVLEHVWRHVAGLRYTNKHVYVLDDSREHQTEHRRLAERFGFTYFERPNKGEMKKAGNLKYAYERTHGEYIAILDADFAPHPDFLAELLPHMHDPRVAIVQSPQYFETTKRVQKRSPIEYGAAFAEEPFYRFIQVTRDRFGGTICCGSNAIYRRKALDDIGGPVQMEFSEDAHTGFALASNGWIVRYVPVILAVGLCPNNIHSFFHQHHRWCMGSMNLMLSKKFWSAPISWQAKFCYVTGFMFYLHQPLVILFSFQLFWTLFFYNQYIVLGTSWLFYPHLVFAITYLALFPIARLRLGYFSVLLAQAYTYSHAIFTALLNRSVGWIPTNSKHQGVSQAFRHMVYAVCMYVIVYLILIALAVRTGVLHFLNYNYYSVQFWLFYNIVLASALLWQSYRAMERVRIDQFKSGVVSKSALLTWQLKTAGSYLLLATTLFAGIVFL